jgi:hypothetical protein
VLSKVIRELAMYWRRGRISVLPYLDGYFFSKKERTLVLSCVYG